MPLQSKYGQKSVQSSSISSNAKLYERACAENSLHLTYDEITHSWIRVLLTDCLHRLHYLSIEKEIQHCI